MRIKVKPAEGLKIRDERTKQVLPVEGAAVEHSTYWQRRIQCGDVVLVEEEKSLEVSVELEDSESKKASKKVGDKK